MFWSQGGSELQTIPKKVMEKTAPFWGPKSLCLDSPNSWLPRFFLLKLGVFGTWPNTFRKNPKHWMGSGLWQLVTPF